MPTENPPLIRLIFFSFGLFAVQTFWGFSSATLPLFLIELTPSETIAGLILSASGVFGAVMPIIAGTLSDRVRWRLGKRKPFIVGGWTVVVIVLVILPQITSLWAVAPLVFVLFAAFFFTMGPYFALLADITTPRVRGRAAGVMFLVGGTGIIIFLLTGARLWDTGHAYPFFWTAATIALSITILVIGVQEAVDDHDTPKDPTGVHSVLTNRRLMTFYTAMILWWSGIWMINFFFVIAAKKMFSASNQEAFFGLFLTTAAYVVLAFPVGVMGDRIGHKRVLMGGLLILALVLCCVPLVPNLKSAYLLMIVAGACYSVGLSVAYAFFLRLIPPGGTARFVGIYMACQNGPLIIGNALGGAAIEHLGPPYLFVGAGCLILLSLPFIFRIHE